MFRPRSRGLGCADFRLIVDNGRPDEMERRFASGWTLVSTGAERQLDEAQTPARFYLY